jgi:hypothetical protein
MSIDWQNFFVVILIQCVLFVAHSWYEKRLRQVPRILRLSIAIGIPFGVIFDLIVGRVLSFYDYKLGFGLFFLTVNGALSYGLMQANVLLMERASFIHFYIWTILVGIVYEVTNFLYPVWEWDFSSQMIELFVVHIFGYIGLALLMACVWHILTRHKFAFFTNFLGRNLLS